MKRGTYFGGSTIILAGEAALYAPRAPKDIPAAKSDIRRGRGKSKKSAKRRAAPERRTLLEAQEKLYDALKAESGTLQTVAAEHDKL